ncbi:unnamed protein product [Clonostachys chloroleuca]|uniref:Uncharacterized protein n=1 Tax=Clonostachys chloroleuca TaxID=1926264 RepID=A0AA35Q2L5_9HYPO|nr:unnamed protein product [Clonostachys chloroleuca]
MTIADAQLERVLADVNLGDAVALVDDMADIPLKSQCCEWRISPVSYLQRTFKYALMLLAVMFDTGCLLSGSHALEYFVPGSCGPGSDWDFYVTAYKESVADIVNVLKACGVTWHAETTRIEEELLRNKYVVISGSKLSSLGSWIKHMTPEAATELIGQQAFEMVQLFNKTSSSRSMNFRFELASSGKLTMRVAGVSPTSELDYEDPFGRSFSILNGHIDTPDGRQKVQLIIGHHYSNIRGSQWAH